MAIKWTDEQRQAIDFEQGKELLISAAAGSGKTAVLTQRILEKSLSGKVRPEELAVLTFTEKAARHMKRKLEEKLDEAIKQSEKDEERERLRQIKRELPLAQISTIHSFCLRLIREYQNELSPEESPLGGLRHFRVMSDTERQSLTDEVLDDLLSRIYSEMAELEDEGLDSDQSELKLYALKQGSALSDFPSSYFVETEAMIRLLAPGKTDEAFRNLAKNSLLFLRSLPHYREFCQRALDGLVEEARGFSASETAQYFLQRFDAAIREARYGFIRLEESPFWSFLYSPDNKSKAKEIKALMDFYGPFKQAILNFPTEEDCSFAERWNAAVELGQRFEDWPALSRTQLGEYKLPYRAQFYRSLGPLFELLGMPIVNDRAMKDFGLDDKRAVFFLEVEEIEKQSQKQLLPTARFLDFLLLLDQEIQAEKQRRRQIDFSDFEHTALLLCEKPEIAEALRLRFKEILIDEYQDSSPLQEAMIQAIGSDQLYMVGDIKQSIYRFRHAEPRLFAGKMRRFLPAAAENASEKGLSILLNQNFRSHPELLRQINRFFSSFLSEESGEIDYDEKQALRAGRKEDSFPSHEKDAPRLSLVYTIAEGKDSEEEEEASEGAVSDEGGLLLEEYFSGERPEAKEVLPLAQAILDLRKEGYAFGDIAVLGRTHMHCQISLDLLDKLGIPAAIGSTKNFLDSPELRLLERWVSLMANAYQDFPLVAILRSDLHGPAFREADLYKIARFKAEELPEEEIKADGGKYFFFRRFRLYAQAGEDEELRARCQAFLDWEEGWRRACELQSVSNCLRRVLEASPWREKLLSKPFASQRLRDVENFLALLEALERSYGHDLSRIAESLREKREKKMEVEGMDRPSEAADAVNIMTMHASKGLEFRAVIYVKAWPGPGKTHSRREDYRLDANAGIAGHFLSEEEIMLSPRALRFKEAEDFAEKAEDYRLLYVAMTRAEERLVVLGNSATSKLESLVSSMVEAQDRAELPLPMIRSCKTDFELLSLWSALEIKELPEMLEQMAEDTSEGAKADLRKEGLHFKAQSLAALTKELRARIEAGEIEASLIEDAAVEEESEESALIIAREKLFYPETEAEQEELYHLMSDELPDQELLELPSKLSVSELKNQEASQLGREAEASGEEPPSRLEEYPEERPLYIEGLKEMALNLRRPEKEKLSGAGYGSFIHRIFQHLPVASFFQESAAVQEDLLPLELLFAENEEANASGGELQVLPPEKLKERYQEFLQEELRLKALLPEELEIAERAYSQIEAFLHSDLARLLAQAEIEGAVIWRELPFTFSLPAMKNSQEITLVQGMLDLYFEHGEKSYLIDYKSDRLSGSQEEREQELHNRYHEQLKYYKLAVERIYGKPVDESWIWLIREARAVRMKL